MCLVSSGRRRAYNSQLLLAAKLAHLDSSKQYTPPVLALHDVNNFIPSGVEKSDNESPSSIEVSNNAMPDRIARSPSIMTMGSNTSFITDNTLMFEQKRSSISTIGSDPTSSCSDSDAAMTVPNEEGTDPKDKDANTRATPKRRRRNRKRMKLPEGRTATNRERQFVEHNYHDHANDPEDDNEDSVTENNNCQELSELARGLSKKRRAHPGGVIVPFPLKLHELLDQLEEDEHGSIIGWQPHGRAFHIHDKKKFIDVIMPKYFKQTRITSFQRQLNLYGFLRLSKGKDNGAYYHEFFLRGRPHLAKKIVRTKCKGTGLKAAGDPDSEPNFYGMSFLYDKRKEAKKEERGCVAMTKEASTVPPVVGAKPVISIDSTTCSVTDSLEKQQGGYETVHCNNNLGTMNQEIPSSISLIKPFPSPREREPLHTEDEDMLDDMIFEAFLPRNIMTNYNFSEVPHNGGCIPEENPLHYSTDHKGGTTYYGSSELPPAYIYAHSITKVPLLPTTTASNTRSMVVTDSLVPTVVPVASRRDSTISLDIGDIFQIDHTGTLENDDDIRECLEMFL